MARINHTFSVRRCYVVNTIFYSIYWILYIRFLHALYTIEAKKRPSNKRTYRSNFPLQGLTTGNYHRRFLIAICRTHRWKIHLFTLPRGLNDKRKYRISIRISMPKKRSNVMISMALNFHTAGLCDSFVAFDRNCHFHSFVSAIWGNDEIIGALACRWWKDCVARDLVGAM